MFVCVCSLCLHLLALSSLALHCALHCALRLFSLRLLCLLRALRLLLFNRPSPCRSTPCRSTPCRFCLLARPLTPHHLPLFIFVLPTYSLSSSPTPTSPLCSAILLATTTPRHKQRGKQPQPPNPRLTPQRKPNHFHPFRIRPNRIQRLCFPLDAHARRPSCRIRQRCTRSRRL